ncbi:ferrous iron transport protein A [Bacillus sp. V3B]|uniref:FeoA domain-containing protein n=1 Tax=Bacillus sp. V3B TaxID=2804915 RepID=UPI002108CC64|nr:FeoA domain-containing protein [Bacillus sp. V3B]MCQ6273379.1 ferrous iron transport protein A [Bacillus sp. V3B]
MLGKLKIGEKGKIIDLSQADRLVRRRLLDLGIIEGTEVCVKGIMPFGGPLMLESSDQSWN